GADFGVRYLDIRWRSGSESLQRAIHACVDVGWVVVIGVPIRGSICGCDVHALRIVAERFLGIQNWRARPLVEAEKPLLGRRLLNCSSCVSPVNGMNSVCKRLMIRESWKVSLRPR